MNMRQAAALLFVFLTSSSHTASVSHIQCQLAETRVTSQGKDGALGKKMMLKDL